MTHSTLEPTTLDTPGLCGPRSLTTVCSTFYILSAVP